MKGQKIGKKIKRSHELKGTERFMVKEFTFVGAKNTQLQGYILEPDEKESVKALIVLIHGLGEHTGRYFKYAQEFTDHGICIYSMDLRGHGKSPGKRGHAAPRRLILEDVDALCQFAIKDYPNMPLFIYGHSMGGNIGLYHRLHGKFRPKGYIITSPWITLYREIPKSTVLAMKLISRIVPSLCIRSNLDIKELSSDQSQIDCEKDPLCHGYVSAQTGLDCYNGAIEIIKKAGIDKEDLLLLHGTEDHICSVEGSRAFMKNAGKSCTYIEFENNYHELHNDKDRDRVAEIIRNWIQERL